MRRQTSRKKKQVLLRQKCKIDNIVFRKDVWKPAKVIANYKTPRLFINKNERGNIFRCNHTNKGAFKLEIF